MTDRADEESLAGSVQPARRQEDPIVLAFDRLVNELRSEVEPLIAQLEAAVFGGRRWLARILPALSVRTMLTQIQEEEISRQRRRRGIAIVRRAVRAVAMPDPKGDRWLAGTYDACRPKLTLEERRALAVEAIRDLRASPRDLRDQLIDLDARFRELSLEVAAGVLQQVRSDRDAARACATLSLKCRAFDDERRRRREAEATAIERVAKTYRSAEHRTKERLAADRQVSGRNDS